MSIIFKQVEHIYGPNTPFSYHALKGVNLNVKSGSMTALIGHTGSGKSTLIQHINALLLPTQGEITIDEFMITATNKPQELKPLRKKAGLVFQYWYLLVLLYILNINPACNLCHKHFLICCLYFPPNYENFQIFGKLKQCC